MFIFFPPLWIYIKYPKSTFKAMKKPIFLVDRWVKFILNEVIYIGITYFFEENAGEPPLQLVFCISNERKPMILNFKNCFNLTYLEFIKKPARLNDLVINNEALTLDTRIDLLICPNISGKTIRSLAENRSNQLIMN